MKKYVVSYELMKSTDEGLICIDSNSFELENEKKLDNKIDEINKKFQIKEKYELVLDLDEVKQFYYGNLIFILNISKLF